MVRFIWQLPFLIVFLSLVLSIGCTPRHIRAAQDHFNKAAAIENRLAQVGAQPDIGNKSTPQNYMVALTEYRLALNLLDQEIEENGKKLRGEELLGTAKVLKLLSRWRILALGRDPKTFKINFQPSKPPNTPPSADTPNPIDTQDLAKKDLEDYLKERNEINVLRYQIQIDWKKDQLRLGTRDVIMLEALPGLLDHDRGLVLTNFQEKEDMFNSAYTIVGDAAQQAPADHDVYIYLRFAQLQTLRGWRSTLLNDFSSWCEEDEPNRGKGNCKNEENIKVNEVDSNFKNVVCQLKPRWKNNLSLQTTTRGFFKQAGVNWPSCS